MGSVMINGETSMHIQLPISLNIFLIYTHIYSYNQCGNKEINHMNVMLI